MTWIAVVHGAKRWFVYPPGYGAPSDLEAASNPLYPVWTWFQSVYPRMAGLTKPPLRGGAEDGGTGYRPLECVQQAGDVVFLPARWSHLTINIGETIAIGGQASLGASQRYASAMDVLKRHPQNYEALKGEVSISCSVLRLTIAHRRGLGSGAPGDGEDAPHPVLDGAAGRQTQEAAAGCQERRCGQFGAAHSERRTAEDAIGGDAGLLGSALH